MSRIAEIAKFVTAVVGALGVALSAGILTGGTQQYVTIAVSVLTALGVFLVPNAAKAPKPLAPVPAAEAIVAAAAVAPPAAAPAPSMPAAEVVPPVAPPAPPPAAA
jgi:hypothetical protein